MTAEPNREEALLSAALAKPRAERAAFLDGACYGDPDLRQRLDVRLTTQEVSGSLAANALTESIRTVIGETTPAEGAGLLIGRYKLLEKLGEGGFGTVWLAEQKEPVRRKVALKIIKLGMDTRQVVARFEAERQALAMMDHPNIAKVLDAGTTELGRPYFVMELVRGTKITEYCDQNSLTTKDRLDLFIKVCQAIQHAHQKGIIHRDIKPSNVMVTLHDGVPVPKVIDFGIAKATQQELTEKTIHTQFQQFIGTPAYMSPEQAEMSGLDVDTRSDIYSLGVVLYELLTGSTPFDSKELMGSGIDAMRKTIREKEPIRPSTRLATLQGDELTSAAKRRSAGISKLLHQLKGDLDWIVMKCLEKDRTRRYETANGLALDLKRHLNNEPVLARPPGMAYRFQKAWWRNKVVFSATAVVAVMLLLGAAVSTWQALRARAAEREQSRLRVEAENARQEELVQHRAANEARQQEAQLRQQAQAEELAARQKAYASDMNLIQQALAANNLGRAQDLLNRQRPHPGQKDLRGWEWRYLWTRCQSDALYQICHRSNSIKSLAVSADGKWLAVGEGSQGGLSIWDLRTRQSIASLVAGESEVVGAFSTRRPLLAFSASTALGSTNAHYSVKLWDGETRRTLDRELEVNAYCRGLAFAPDGETLFTLTLDNRLSVWRVPEGSLLRSVSVPAAFGRTPPLAFAVTQDGSLAAYASTGGRICTVDLSNGKVLWTAKASKEFVTALTFSPDGKTLASGAGFAESAIRLWEVASGKELSLPLEDHRAWVGALVFWPDGSRFASGSADQTIRLWDLANRSQPKAAGRPLLGHKLEVWRLALLPDNTTLISGCKDGSVYAWNTAKARRESDRITLPAELTAWSFGTNGDSVVTVSRQGLVAVRKGNDFQDEEPLMQIGTNSFEARLSHDGGLLAVRSGDSVGVVGVWDLRQRKLLKEFPLRNNQTYLWGFMPYGTRLVTFDRVDRSYHLWDLKTWTELPSWGPRGLTDFAGLVVSSDEQQILVKDFTSARAFWQTASGLQTNAMLDIPDMEAATFSADGKLLAGASSRGFARVWETATLRPLATLSGFLLGVHSVGFAPDGERLAAGSSTREAVKLFDVKTQQEMLTLEGEGSLFQRTVFSPDGKVLGSMNAQGLLHLWRAPSWEEIAAAETKEESEHQHP